MFTSLCCDEKSQAMIKSEITTLIQPHYSTSHFPDFFEMIGCQWTSTIKRKFFFCL